MKLLLISGHGAGDPGAVAGQWKEADETRRMTAAVAAALAGRADVDLYPTARNAYADYRSGALDALARFARYDYVLEIHFNAFQSGSSDGKRKGTELYTPAAACAADQAILRQVCALGFPNRGLKDGGHLAVISAACRAGTAAALLEVCFLDDPDDMALYAAGPDRVARAVAAGIAEGFGLPDMEQEEKTVIYQTLEEVPAWAKPTVEKLLKKGYLTGTGQGLGLEHNMLRVLVINDRAGLYG